MQKASKTPFYGTSVAAGDFLQVNNIYYTRSNGNYTLFAERGDSGQERVYLFEYMGDLRLLSMPFLAKGFKVTQATAAQLDKLRLDELYEAVEGSPEAGQVVFHKYEEGQNIGLALAACDEAKKNGATAATGRWYMRLVEQAFQPIEEGIEHSSEGVLIDTSSMLVEPSTVLRQLKSLQKINALKFWKQPEGGLIVKFNSAFLAGLNPLLAPRFFQAMQY